MSLIGEYTFWSVYLHQNQGYLGRCVVWCKREDAIDFVDARDGEIKELLQILRRLRKVHEKLFRPDLINYAFLGNVDRHLHCHFVPRYKEKRVYKDVVFEDKTFGQNYRTDKNYVLSSEVFESIRNDIAVGLNVN